MGGAYVEFLVLHMLRARSDRAGTECRSLYKEKPRELSQQSHSTNESPFGSS